MRKGSIIAWCLLILFLISVAISYQYAGETFKEQDECKISVIVYGSNRERWDFMKEGINQGILETGAEVNFVTMSKNTAVEEQKKILIREIENGAQGIILAPTGSKSMQDSVEEIVKEIPVLLIENDLEDNEKTLGYLSADHYEMGCMLGTFLQEYSYIDHIAIVTEFFERNNVRARYQGLIDTISSDIKVEEWKRGEGDYNLSLYLKKMYHEMPEVEAVFLLDDIALEAGIDMAEELGKEYEIYPKLFGIGATDKIVHYLDRDYVSGIVFQNEFSIGYIAIQNMVNYINTHGQIYPYHKNTISCYKTDKNSLYEPQIQRLLFPDVQ